MKLLLYPLMFDEIISRFEKILPIKSKIRINRVKPVLTAFERRPLRFLDSGLDRSSNFGLQYFSIILNRPFSLNITRMKYL